MYLHSTLPSALCAAVQDPKYDSRGPGGNTAPFEFDTGMGLVPEAVDMAVRLMTPQEVSTVAAQPKYAYRGRSDRPPVSTCPRS